MRSYSCKCPDVLPSPFSLVHVGHFLSPWAETYTPVLQDQSWLLLAPAAWSGALPSQPSSECRQIPFPFCSCDNFRLHADTWAYEPALKLGGCHLLSVWHCLDGHPPWKAGFYSKVLPGARRFTCGLHTSIPLPRVRTRIQGSWVSRHSNKLPHYIQKHCFLLTLGFASGSDSAFFPLYFFEVWLLFFSILRLLLPQLPNSTWHIWLTLVTNLNTNPCHIFIYGIFK